MAKKTSTRKTADKKVARSASKSAGAVKKAAAKAISKTSAAPAKVAKPKVATKTVAKPVAVKKPAAPAPQPVIVKGKVKCPLSKKELNEFRELLLAKRRTLVGDMTGMEAEAFRANRQDGSGDLSTMPVHMADIGTDNYEQEFTLGLLESERQLLREINEALDRIEKGTYGICMGTGTPISLARLKAKPWAKYGIEYARQVEQGLVRQNVSAAMSVSDEDEDEVEDEEQADDEEEAEVDIDEELAAQEAEDDLSL